MFAQYLETHQSISQPIFIESLRWEAKNILMGLPVAGKLWLLANFSNSKFGKLTRASLLPARVHSYCFWPKNPSSYVGHAVKGESDEYLIFSCFQDLRLGTWVIRDGRNTAIIINCTLFGNNVTTLFQLCPWWLSLYRHSLRARRFGDRILVWTRFSAPVHTGTLAHTASYTMGTGFLSRE
jgi:hypothetical protein